jgi:hypothetical protein
LQDCDKIPISEIALAWRKKPAQAVVEEFKKFVLATPESILPPVMRRSNQCRNKESRKTRRYTLSDAHERIQALV